MAKQSTQDLIETVKATAEVLSTDRLSAAETAEAIASQVKQSK